MKKILIIHGPNLNLLGTREPEIYGKITLKEINSNLHQYAKEKKISLKIVQSNLEGEIINLIQKAKGEFDGIIINPAAYSHYSLAIFDSVLAVGIPTIEVHLSNIYKREEFRRKSVIAPACMGQICGFGLKSYIMAVDAFIEIFERKNH